MHLFKIRTNVTNQMFTKAGTGLFSDGQGIKVVKVVKVFKVVKVAQVANVVQMFTKAGTGLSSDGQGWTC